MTMKLSGFNGLTPRSTGAVASAAENGVKSAKTGAARTEKRDTIVISQEGSQQSEASRLAKTLAGEIAGADNSEKITRLRANIAGGAYHVASADVAKAMLDGLFA